MIISKKLLLTLITSASVFFVNDIFAQSTSTSTSTSTTATATCSQQNPQAFIQNTVNGVLGILQQDASEMTTNFSQVQQDVATYLQPYIGIQAMSAYVAGQLWQSASAADQASFQQVFFNYITNTYTTAFQQYSPAQQSTQVYPSRSWQCGQTSNVQVNMMIVNQANSAGNIPISFILMPNANSWLLVDFIVSNVDAISNIQSQIQGMNAATLAALTVAINNHNTASNNN